MRMNLGNSRAIILLFVLGWGTYIFSLANVGPISLTLLLMTSLALGFMAFRAERLLDAPFASLLASLVVAWCTSVIVVGGVGRPTMHVAQGLIALGVLGAVKELDWNSLFPYFRKAFYILAIICFLYGIYQFVARNYDLPLAFLPITNAQIGDDMGFQRGYHKIVDEIGFTRVSSFFAEPSDFARFMLWVFCLGAASDSSKARFIIPSIAASGVILSQSLGGVFALSFIFIVMVITFRNYLLLAKVLICIAISFSLAYFLIPDVLNYLRSRALATFYGGMYHLETTGRFRDFSDAWDMIYDRPMLGHGLASIGSLMSGMILSDSYTILLFERGVVGALLFFLPFLTSPLLLIAGGPAFHRDEMIRAAYLIGVAEIFFFFTFGQVYFPPLYLCLGFQIYCIRKIHGSTHIINESR